MLRTWIALAAALVASAGIEPAVADTILFCAVGGASQPKLWKYQVAGTRMKDLTAPDTQAADAQGDRNEMQVVQDTPDALVAVRSRKATEVGRSTFSVVVTVFALNKRTGAMRERSFSPDRHEPDQEKEGQCAAS